MSVMSPDGPASNSRGSSVSPTVVLLVDADIPRQQETGKILCEEGFEVVPAATARQAAELFDAELRIALVICRVILPDESGLHVVKHIQQSGRGTKTLLTSHFNRDLLRNVPGFSEHPDFLPNPFTRDQLLFRVRRLLNPGG